MRTIEVSEETYDKIKWDLQEEERVDISSTDDMLDQSFFFRAVTYHCVGKVVKKMGKFLELSGASWVASSGKFSEAISKGTLDEVELLGTMWINLDTVVDMFPWKHKLPKETK
jgi:hypothetical protein